MLVVDDDPAVHDLLTATLSRRKATACCMRATAPRRCDILRKTPPDIVTLDVMMPKVDGWSVLGIMKSDPALDHIPVIMITIVDDRNLGYRLGASEFMTKPIDRARLRALVQSFAGQRGAVAGADRRRRRRGARAGARDAGRRGAEDRGGGQRPRRASNGSTTILCRR